MVSALDSRMSYAVFNVYFQNQPAPLQLGAPHLHPPEGANDATRGALKWVNAQWPGAHFAETGHAAGDGGVRYTCVTGRTIRGSAGVEADGTLSGRNMPISPTYTSTCDIINHVYAPLATPSTVCNPHSLSNITLYDVASIISLSLLSGYASNSYLQVCGQGDAVEAGAYTRPLFSLIPAVLANEISKCIMRKLLTSSRKVVECKPLRGGRRRGAQ
jgi:hypothetical protein